MKVADYILKRLEMAGLKDIFCFPGGGCLFLVDAINRTSIRPIFNLHEQACAICAEGYAQATNSLGALLVTTGPGVLNAMTGVAAAYYDSIPLIVLSGQVNTTQRAKSRGVRQYAPQEVPTGDLVKPIVKQFYELTSAIGIADIMADALNTAVSGRPGPVWIDVPLDVQQMEVIEEKPYQVAIPKDDDDKEINRCIKSIITLLEISERPVILVGNGVRLAGATDTLRKILEYIRVPVLTSWKALDLFEEDHPLYCGRPGIVAERGPNWTQQASDLLICLGTRLDLCQTAFNHTDFAPSAHKIIVDVDVAELSKFKFGNKTLIEANLNTFMSRLCEKICGQGWNALHYENQPWLDQCKKWRADYPLEEETTDKVSLYHFFNELSKLLTKDDVVVLGSSGSVSEVGQQAIKIIHRGTRVFCSPGLGAMGFGLPEAIGAAVAGARRVICVEGDGSFAMNMHELALVKAMKLPIVFFVLNNGGYVSIINSQNNLCGGRLLGVTEQTGLHLPCYYSVAKCFDIPYMSLRNNYEVDEFLTDVVNTPSNAPYMCELFGNPNHQSQPRTKTVKNPDGSLTNMGMSNMWPFIERI